MKYLSLLILIYFLYGLPALYAQNAVPAAGGNVTGAGGSVSYTVGQTVYTALGGPSGYVTQGCQQPYEVIVLTGSPEVDGIQLDIKAFPNPTTDFIRLVLNRDNPENWRYRLYNNQGVLLQERVMSGREMVIPMDGLPPAAYILHIFHNQREINSFIIIKN